MCIRDRLEEAFADKDMKIFPISAVSGQGVKELLWYVNDLLKELPEEPIEFDQEYFFELQEDDDQESIVVKMEEPGVYSVEGPKVCLLYTSHSSGHRCVRRMNISRKHTSSMMNLRFSIIIAACLLSGMMLRLQF